MKMKNENVREQRRWKMMLKNIHLFLRTATSISYFVPSLKELYLTYSPLKNEFGFTLELADHSLQHPEGIIKQCEELVRYMPAAQQAELLKQIDGLLKMCDLGEEWKGTMIAIVVSGILCPPVFNLYLGKESIEAGSNLFLDLVSRPRVFLALNPDTSIDDIKNSWPEVEQLQRSLRPKFKGFNITKNSTKELVEQIRFLSQKNVSEKEQYAELSSYEEQLWKQEKRHGKSDDDIRKILNKRPTEDGSVRKSVKIKKQKTDREVVKMLHPRKSKKERDRIVNQIRKRRERLRR